MKILKTQTLCYFLLVLSLNLPVLSAQSIQEVDRLIGSPEAAEFAKYGNLDVSLYKGVPNITIPIYTLELKDFSLPVYLSYDAGGVKVDQIATSVGLGWSLHASGQISAMTHALSDVLYEYVEPYNLETFNPNLWDTGGSTAEKDDYDFAWEIFESAFAGDPKNTKPDVYFFNYPGNNGKFVKKSEIPSFASVPYSNHQINYSTGAFQITDEHGNVFKFEEMEITISAVRNCNGGPGSVSLSAGSPVNSSMIPDETHSWHLTEIVTTNGDVIEFEYQVLNGYSYDAQIVQQKYRAQGGNHFHCESNISDYQCTVEKHVTPTILKKIVHQRSGTEIRFFYGSRSDFGGNRLDKIGIYKDTDVGLYPYEEYTLNHTYFQSSGGTDHRYKRLRLDSVTKSGYGTYSFTYDNSAFPERGSYSQDTWGYYNGQFNSTLVPNGNGLTGAANRDVYTSFVDNWTMTEITWPTGGKTILDMEADPEGGGLRVASIHDLDGLGNTVGLRNYSYQRETFLTPLYLDYYSYYGDNGDTQSPVDFQCHYDMYTATSVQPVSTLDGPDYGYSQVTIDYDNNGEKGRTIVNFATELSDLTGSPGYVGALAWGRGEQTSETHFKYNGSGYSPVQKSVQTYNVRSNASGSIWSSPTYNHENYIYGMDIQLSNPEYRNSWGQLVMPARFEVYKYRIISAWYHPDETISYVYDPDDDTQYVRTEVKKIFNTNTTRLTSVIEENSDAQVRSTHYTYGVAGKPSKLTSVAVKNSSGEVIQKRWANWSSALGSGRQELHQIWDWTHGNPSQSPSTSNAVLAQQVSTYDTYGNPKTVLDANGHSTTYYYGSNSNPLSYTSLHGTNGVYLTGIRKDENGGSSFLTSKATYDVYGRLTSILDHNDNTTTFGWDSLHRLEEVRNDNNDLVEEYDYMKMYQGGTYNETYSNYIQTLRYDGSQTRTSRAYVDGLGRPIQSQMQGDGHTIISAMEYNGQGRPWKTYKPYTEDGSIAYQSGYDAAAQTEYGTDPFVESLYEASPLGRAEETIPEGGGTSSGSIATNYEIRTWNSNKWLVTSTSDEEGKAAENWADGWGRTIRTIADPGVLDIQTQFDYDELDQLVKVYHPNHFTETGDWTTDYVYDNRGLLTQKTSIDAGTTNYKYDPAGNVRFIQDAVHAATSDVVFMRYDFAGRLIEEGVGNIGTTNFEDLDAAGTENFENDQINLVGFNQYDIKADHNNFPWNQFSDQITSVNITNPDGNLTGRAWRFNNYGAPENVNLNGIGITQDETYLAITSITAENIVVSSGSELVLSAGETVTLKPGFEVELGALLTANIDENILSEGLSGISSLTGSNNWQVELFSYDQENRVSDKWIWTGNRREWDTHLEYEYNRLGEVTQMKLEVGTETLYQHYEYNLLGQLHKVFISTTGSYDPVNDDPEVTYTYTPSGAIDLIVYEGGKQADYGYNIRDWVTSINSIGSPAGSFAALYEYKKNGNISMSRFYNPDIDISSTHRDYRYAYTYDELSRLTGANYSFGSSGSGSTFFDVEGLSYDDNGNILSVLRRDETGATFDNLTYNYGSNNRLSSVSENATTHHGWDAYTSSFTYDANGNMKSQSGKFTDVAYDHRNLPIHFFMDGGAEVIANYNADGQRIIKESSGGAWTYYMMDGMQTLAVITQDGLSHMNLVGSGTFGRIEANGSGTITTSNTRYYHITDHLGSTREVVNNSGSMVETFDYYPFGLLMPGRNGGTNLTLEKFTGKERDTEVGLNLDYFGARYYDPAIGRWHSVDPKASEFPAWNAYNYAKVNPINLFDPDGKAPICITCIANTGIQSALSLMTHVKAYFGDTQAKEALNYSYKTMGEMVVTTVSEPIDWALTGYDVVQNGPEWYHAAALLPFVTSNTARTTVNAFKSFRSPTRSNFRENLTRLTGYVPSGAEAHHVLPNKFESDFGKAGVNIHNPKYGSWWEKNNHRSNANAYNNQWSEFFQRNESPNIEQIENFAKRLADEYGFEINF